MVAAKAQKDLALTTAENTKISSMTGRETVISPSCACDEHTYGSRREDPPTPATEMRVASYELGVTQ